MPELAEALNDWYYNVHYADPRTRNLPIWITETGWLHCWEIPGWGTKWSDEAFNWVRDNLMKPLSWWFAGDPAWQSRYPGVPVNPGHDSALWFIPYDSWESTLTYYWCTYLEKPDGTRSPLGEFWETYNLGGQ